MTALVTHACGGKRGGSRPAAAVGAYSATRWIPGQASYALTARTVRDAQQRVRDAIDTVGLVGGVTVADVSRELARELRVDLLSPDAVAELGIDLEGGLAVFSDAYNPTIVVRLASAAAFQAWIERQQLRRQSVVLDGTEVFTAPLSSSLRLSWAVADDWLWIHLLVRGVADDSATWFTRSRKPGTPTWAAEISNGNGAPVVGFVDTARFLADAQGQVPAIAQCASQLQLAGNLGRVGIALSGDPQVTRARFSVDVGALAPRIASSALAVPEGFAKAVAQAPLAVQWNLDLAAVRARLDPCMRLFDVDLGAVEQIGIRAGRAFVRTFDADEREGTGALSLDLAHKRFLADKLDDIPLRSTLERKRTFGPYAGKSLSIPMFLSVDYVLQDQLALAGVGDGLLLAMIGSGGSVPGPLAELAVQPLGLSVESWTALFELAEIHNANAVATQLQRWREVRVNLAIEGTRLVLAASGTRR